LEKSAWNLGLWLVGLQIGGHCRTVVIGVFIAVRERRQPSVKAGFVVAQAHFVRPPRVIIETLGSNPSSQPAKVQYASIFGLFNVPR
jgi:hypothetical protein